MIPLSVPNFIGNETKYVLDAIQTEWVSTGGAYINRFEEQIAKYVGVNKAVACQSGTAGLHVALLLCGVKTGDLVIVPTLTFIAAVNPVKYIGADPVFMDCDDYLCLDTRKLRTFCERECHIVDGGLYHNSTNRRVSAVVAVHVFGNMVDMIELMDIANQYHLKVIEDATEVIGTYYLEGKYIGRYAGAIGDVGVYSFNGNKIITSGGGGMIVSPKEEMMIKAKHLTTQAKSDELYYEHDEIGYNYRMTNLQAALGLAQFEQLETFIERKNKNYEIYAEILANKRNMRLLPFRANIRSNRWFYALYLNDESKRDILIRQMADAGIQTRPIWGLIHEQRPYLGSLEYQIKKAKDYRAHVINIPCSTSLTELEISQITNKIEELL